MTSIHSLSYAATWIHCVRRSRSCHYCCFFSTVDRPLSPSRSGVSILASRPVAKYTTGKSSSATKRTVNSRLVEKNYIVSSVRTAFSTPHVPDSGAEALASRPAPSGCRSASRGEWIVAPARLAQDDWHVYSKTFGASLQDLHCCQHRFTETPVTYHGCLQTELAW